MRIASLRTPKTPLALGAGVGEGKGGVIQPTTIGAVPTCHEQHQERRQPSSSARFSKSLVFFEAVDSALFVPIPPKPVVFFVISPTCVVCTVRIQPDVTSTLAVRSRPLQRCLCRSPPFTPPGPSRGPRPRMGGEGRGTSRLRV